MRKTGPALIAGLLIVVLLSACGGGGGTPKKASLSGAAGASTSAVCKSTPVRGGNLVYERQAETQTLDPLQVLNGNGDIFTYNLIYSGLVRSDPTGGTAIKPSLADRWTTSADGKTYTFHLRAGLKFSNGQPVTAEDVKRVMIALATASQPRLLLADEPTTALDVTTQAQILALLTRLREERGMSVLLVSHDFGVIAQVCDRVAVMYRGRLVEVGETAAVFGDPQDDYTKALLGAHPHPRLARIAS